MTNGGQVAVLVEKSNKEVVEAKESDAQRGDAAETLRRKQTPSTAEYGIKVRKLRGKDGLFKVTDLENKAICYVVDLNAKTCACSDFTDGKKCPHIEIVENIGEIRNQKRLEQGREHFKKYYRENREKFIEIRNKYRQNTIEKVREYNRKYQQRRYHSDPNFREKYLESQRRTRERYREAFKRLKVALGEKCAVCGEDDPDVLVIHHLDGREEKNRSLFQTKEFRNWYRYGIMPKVILVCGTHHLKIHKTKGDIHPNPSQPKDNNIS